ncbi:hypothetical protein JG687_00018138 [Phytophthora cactorum]|uniref:PiggyBac transposable element-derived protein domain-containing protein n=1 Tax=Phytophthora cactorum TaxID=29920 RepID=A0A8T1TNB9_9STRA|nr:hypothetical protein JG687_00018138 [Phytophthora cactorum]
MPPKSIADSESGVLLGLELVEGSSRQVTNPCACEYGEGAAVVLRPAEPYKGTGCTMVTDSAFGSVWAFFMYMV